MIYLDSGTRTARKAHRCDQCFHKIEPGNRYHYSTAADAGTVSTFKTCVPCGDLARELYNAGVYGYDEYDCECYPYLPDVDRDEVPAELAGRFDAWRAAL